LTVILNGKRIGGTVGLAARTDRYSAVPEVEGPQGAGVVDARSSDALNLAVLTDAPVFVSSEMLAGCIGRQEGDSAQAARLQGAIAAPPMTVRRADR